MYVALYWLVRTAIFLVVFAVLWSLRWFDIFAVLVAFVLAWAVGYLAFPAMRRRAAEQMDGWITRGHKGIENDAHVEDAETGAN